MHSYAYYAAAREIYKRSALDFFIRKRPAHVQPRKKIRPYKTNNTTKKKTTWINYNKIKIKEYRHLVRK